MTGMPRAATSLLIVPDSNLKNQHSALINLLPTADTTTAYFDALGRSTHLADWQSRQTTMIYLRVMKRPGAGAPSPLDFG